MLYGWDWPAAEASLARALELDPNSAVAHEVKSIFLITRGRFDEAMTQAQRARALDPLSPFINMGVAWVHHFAGRPEEAIRECLDVRSLRPGTRGIRQHPDWIGYESLGRFEEAAALIKQQTLLGDGARRRIAAERASSAAAREKYLRERVAQMESAVTPPPATSFAFAICYAQLGEFDKALDHLDHMVTQRAGGSVFIGIDPRTGAATRPAPLRSDRQAGVCAPAANGLRTA